MLENMKYDFEPPSYEESNIQYNITSPRVDNVSFTLTRGPDAISMGHYFLIADFIPWTESYPCEDIGYLLLRANNWLHSHPIYDVEKCEMIPRMINSKGKLEISNCYIFNMSCGRKYFVNQLRIHIQIKNSKTVPDLVCLRTIIPELIQGMPGNVDSPILLLRLQNVITSCQQFQSMTDIISKLNKEFQDCKITGSIINISTFYLNIINYLKKSETELQDQAIFYDESYQGKCHLKCLRIFYKPGPKIDGIIGFKSFVSNSKLGKTLDDLTNSAIDWILNQNNQNFISMEVFQEYSAKDDSRGTQKIDDSNSTFIFNDKCSTVLRKEVINLFYLKDDYGGQKEPKIIDHKTDIIWITPRKDNNIYETYDSFMEYVTFVLENYEEHILDVETVLIQNPLCWSSIRHQTLERYYNDTTTNYQIYTVRLIVYSGKIVLPLKGAPLPYASPTKYTAVCNVV